MNIEYIKNVPQWFKEQKKLDLVLSNDIDSLLSCALLKEVKGWNVKYFYDFEKCYASKKIQNKTNERCWVDVAVLNGEKSFDNHVSMVSVLDAYNEQMINPNLITNVNNECYADKYAGSTALLIWSLYNLPIPDSEEAKMILLSIDCAFKGHYSDKFAEANKFYLCDMLGFEELYDVILRHDINEFYGTINKYRLNESIYIKDGKLKTKLNLKKIGELLGVDLQLPDDSCLLWKKYKIRTEKIIEGKIFTTDQIEEDIFSLAFTYKDNARYSKVV